MPDGIRSSCLPDPRNKRRTYQSRMEDAAALLGKLSAIVIDIS